MSEIPFPPFLGSRLTSYLYLLSEQAGCLIGAAIYLSAIPMKILWIGIAGLLVAAAVFKATAVEEETFEVYTTPKGTYRLERNGGDDSQVFVLEKSSGQREPLPDASTEDPTECTVIYGASPDEKWIFRSESWRHHAVQDRHLYHHDKGARFVYFKDKEWFTNAIIADATKEGGFKKADFYMQRGTDVFEDHLHAHLVDWSPDSARLFLRVGAGGDYRNETPKQWYVYFNTRTSGFELTPYLQALNKAAKEENTENAVACAEPIDALPAEAELKTRAEKADQALKEWFANRKAHLKENETAEDWQETEKAWIKARDDGLKLYLQFAPEKDREKRRLQFLGDVTAVRLAYVKAGWSF